jgi:glycosyltransferase involved in cell wall biosynthesis
MKILLYGEASREGSGAWCYAETLVELGHTVLRFSERACLEAYDRHDSLRVLRRVLNGPLEIHRKRHTASFLDAIHSGHPDIVIVLKGLHLGPDDIANAKRAGSWVVNINHDDFFSRNRTNWSQRQRAAIPAYDHVFTTRAVNVGEVASMNGNVELMEFAYFPRIHRPACLPASKGGVFDSDVVFVGTWESERALLLEELVQRVPARYAVWGSQWHKLRRNSPLRRHVVGRETTVEEMPRVLGGAGVALAFLRKENRDDYTQRSFEIPACGGLLLAERTARHQAMYSECVEAEFFSPEDPAELAEKVRSLLSDRARRDAIREAGHLAVSRGSHTYRDRMLRLLLLYQRHRAPQHDLLVGP